jgi:hypothetical protein
VPRSRRLSLRVFHRIPVAQRSYVALLGVLHAGLMLSLLKVDESRFNAGLVLAVTALAAVLLPGHVGSLSDLLQRATSLGVAPRDAGPAHRLFIVMHILAQIALGYGGSRLWLRLPFPHAFSAWPLLWAVLIYGPVLGIAGAMVSAAYLLVSSPTVRANRELLMAAVGDRSQISFLRMHIDTDGRLHLYPIVGVTAHRWYADPAEQPQMPFFQPHEPIRIGLIEPPVTFDA